ncbi:MULTISPECIES: hypothetical protein [Brevundimonas]
MRNACRSRIGRLTHDRSQSGRLPCALTG